MEYNYLFSKINKDALSFTVVYSAEGRESHFKTFPTTTFEESAMREIAENYGKSVVYNWTVKDGLPEEVSVNTGISFTASYEEQPQLIMKAPPDINEFIQQATVSETTNANGVPIQVWTVADKEPEQKKEGALLELRLKRTTSCDRSDIDWVDSNDISYRIPTDLTTRSALAAAINAGDAGNRPDDSLWKMKRTPVETGDLDSEGVPVLQFFNDEFRPTTLAELKQIQGKIQQWIDGCFAAEKVIFDKIQNGDYTGDYQAEVDKITI